MTIPLVCLVTNLVSRVESVEEVVRVVLEPPGLPDLPHTAHVRGTGPELVSVQGDHPGPVAGVRTAPDTARQLVQVDALAGTYLLEMVKIFLSTPPVLRC